MHQKKQEVTNSIQIVCFKIGSEEYGIDILQVQEILKIPKVIGVESSTVLIRSNKELSDTVIFDKRDFIAYSLLILFLLFRPNGILGKKSKL